MEASEMYSRTIQNLRRSVEHHQLPGGRAGSVKGFAEVYGFSRQNLVEVFGGHQELSVATFLRLAAVLGGHQLEALPPGVERWSLHTWLAVKHYQVEQAMYTVNFAG